jgi:ankyrin repeat protein
VFFFLQALLDKQVPVNSQDDVGSSPLCWAASHGHIEPARLLLQRSAFVNCVDVEGMTPLHYACIYKDCPKMISLLLEYGADPNCEESVSYRRPLDVALQFERRDYAKLIEVAGGKRSTRLLRNGDMAIARRKELKKKHQQEIQNEARKLKKETVAPAVASVGSAAAVVATSSSPIAVRPVPVVPVIVARSADEDDSLRGHCWFNNRHAEFKEFLSRPIFDFSTPFKSYNNGTALILAASRGHMETVRALADKGVDLDAVNLDKCNAFNWAVTQKHFEVASLLVSRGCSVDLLDKHGMSSLHYACIAKEFDLNLVVFLVEQAKCKINLLSSNSRTALDLAVSRNRPALISFLKSKGAKAAVKPIKRK